MMEPRTGRVLAVVGHGDEGNAALQSTAPSASIFKIVTAAALLDRGVTPRQKVCYQPNPDRPSTANILGTDSKSECSDLATAFGRSTNPVFARLAHQHLSRLELQEWAARFGYNEPIPFALPTQISKAEIPGDKLDRARTAAGFWNTHLSPLHAAMISSSVAAGGVMMHPAIIANITDAAGEVLYRHSPRPWKVVMKPKVARDLADMMRYTTTVGTARTYFADDRDWPSKSGYIVAGKTGTLVGSNPYTMYNWFVGFGPLSEPDVAIAVVLHNPARWRIKAGFAASWMLRTRVPTPAVPRGIGAPKATAELTPPVAQPSGVSGHTLTEESVLRD
jgi:cell division protein FtsI/penicillin-binding protein 2